MVADPATTLGGASTTAPVGDTFTSETSRGPIEWVKVTLDHPLGSVIVVDRTLMAQDYENQTWWQSSDGVTWVEAEAPSPPWSVTSEEIGGVEWAVNSPDGYGVMMGPDSYRQVIARYYCESPEEPGVHKRVAGEWEEVALPSTRPGPVAGLRVEGPLLGEMTALGSSGWVLPLTYLVTVPWGDEYGRVAGIDDFGCDRGDPWPTWNAGTGQLEIHQADTHGLAMARLDVELRAGDPEMIRFVDDDTGTVVKEIPASYPGWSAQEMMEEIRGWGFEDHVLVVSDGETMSVTRPPWPRSEEWMGEMVSLDGVAYTMSFDVADDYSASSINLWRTHDGRRWERLDLPSLGVGPLERADLVEVGGLLFMTIHDMSDGGSLWRSTDGESWDQVTTPISPTHQLVETDFGWILFDSFGPDAFSVDGRTWEPFEMPPLGESSLEHDDGLLFLGPMGSGEHYTMWVGRLSD
jgi:hypothetical protein